MSGGDCTSSLLDCSVLKAAPAALLSSVLTTVTGIEGVHPTCVQLLDFKLFVLTQLGLPADALQVCAVSCPVMCMCVCVWVFVYVRVCDTVETKVLASPV